MQAELKQRWIDALLSGDYTQARGDMKTESGYCCLGVLCDVSGLGYWEDNAYVIGTNAMRWWPDDDEREMMGLDGEDMCRMMSMNDHGKSFPEIAGHIEESVQ